MRLHRLIVVAVLGAGSVLGVACGLDQGGLLVELDGGKDSTVPDGAIPDVVIDVPIIDVYVPPPCTTLDASCLPAFPADAWTPVAVLLDGGACPIDPDAGWSTIPLKTNPTLVPGSCSCGCSATAANCAPEGGATVGYNSNCNNSANGTLTLPINTCVTNSTPNGGLTATYGPQTAASSCDASSTGDAQVTTTPITACATPSCAINFCGMAAQGYKLCIMQSGIRTCPAGYVPRATGLNAGAACLGCGCSTAPVRCSATLESFVDTTCGTVSETYSLDGGCNPNASSESMKLTVVRGSPTCDASAGNGTAQLTQPQTVCCIP